MYEPLALETIHGVFTGASDWQQSTDESLKNWKLLVGLEKGTYYEVRVVAYDGYTRVPADSKVAGTDGFG